MKNLLVLAMIILLATGNLLFGQGQEFDFGAPYREAVDKIPQGRKAGEKIRKMTFKKNPNKRKLLRVYKASTGIVGNAIFVIDTMTNIMFTPTINGKIWQKYDPLSEFIIFTYSLEKGMVRYEEISKVSVKTTTEAINAMNMILAEYAGQKVSMVSNDDKKLFIRSFKIYTEGMNIPPSEGVDTVGNLVPTDILTGKPYIELYHSLQ